MKYNVLQIVYTATKERDEKGNKIFEVSFKKVGVANNMDDAKRKFGGYPVLEKN